MIDIRVIPTLLLSNDGLVKGQKFKKHIYIGDPINTIKIFNEKEVHELAFFDILATNKNKGPNFKLLSEIASQAFFPLSYGGGIRKLEDIEKLFYIGFEKAIINTHAVKNIRFVRDASKIAGSQSVVVSIDVRQNIFGKYSVYTNSGSYNSGLDPFDFAKKMEDAGAGELVVCCIDKEGCGSGYDLNLINKISNNVSIPVVASGGAHDVEDFKKAIKSGASAVAAGDMFTFYGKHKAVLITYPSKKILSSLCIGRKND